MHPKQPLEGGLSGDMTVNSEPAAVLPSLVSFLPKLLALPPRLRCFRCGLSLFLLVSGDADGVLYSITPFSILLFFDVLHFWSEPGVFEDVSKGFIPADGTATEADSPLSSIADHSHYGFKLLWCVIHNRIPLCKDSEHGFRGNIVSYVRDII